MDEIPLTNIPRVIRDLLKEIVDEDFDGSVTDAAEEISRVGRERFGETRQYPAITRAILYNLLGDKSQIKFGHLEMIAHYLGVPVGVMLIYTRSKAAMRDNNAADMDYVKSVLQVLHESLEQQDSLSLENLREIGTGNVQLSLFD